MTIALHLLARSGAYAAAMGRPSVLLVLLLAAPGAARAADLAPAAPPAVQAPAYGYGLENWRRQQRVVPCPLWQPPYGIRIVPTNDRCDPTYVGSSMGLSRPSYYGNLPPPGYDAP
jgi:hypothetical protein